MVSCSLCEWSLEHSAFSFLVIRHAVGSRHCPQYQERDPLGPAAIVPSVEQRCIKKVEQIARVCSFEIVVTCRTSCSFVSRACRVVIVLECSSDVCSRDVHTLDVRL